VGWGGHTIRTERSTSNLRKTLTSLDITLDSSLKTSLMFGALLEKRRYTHTHVLHHIERGGKEGRGRRKKNV
jgi:hypothetical protein